jgi:hypothetical protein
VLVWTRDRTRGCKRGSIGPTRMNWVEVSMRREDGKGGQTIPMANARTVVA